MSLENVKLSKNILPNKSGNPEKMIITSRKLSIKCAYSCQGFVDGILQVKLFMILRSKLSVKKNCVVKIFLAIWKKFLMMVIVIVIVMVIATPTNLVTPLPLYFCFTFVKSKSKNQFFSK